MKTNLLLPALLCLVTCLQAQRPFDPYCCPQASWEVVQQFTGARCLKTTRHQDTISQYGSYQIRQTGQVYTTPGEYPLTVYFSQSDASAIDTLTSRERKPIRQLANLPTSSTNTAPLVLLARGFFDGSHLTIPLPYQGWYFVVINDRQRPSLIRIDATSKWLVMDFHQVCVLHQ